MVRTGFANALQQLRTLKALVSIDCCHSRDFHKFRDPCVLETELWYSGIQLSDNGLDLRYEELQASDVGGRLYASFSLIEQMCSHLVSICDLG